MKTRLTLIASIFLLMALSLPAMAGVLYENGPINGETDAWTINFGFVMSDTITISTGPSTINGFSFGAWLFAGDTLESAEVSFTSQAFGGTTYFDQVVNFTASNCFLNNFGYDVCTETGNFHGFTLGNGGYWVNLQNAVANNGDPVYWDENSGIGCHSPGCPSIAGPGLGTDPSEAFSILGSPGIGTTPEPSSLALFASGVIGVAAVVRRKLL
jgi:PEP-CTERM motif